MLSNYESVFRKAGIAEADCAFNMWSEDRFPATALYTHQRSPTFSIGCRLLRPKMLETPRKFKNPLKLPSPPPHKGSSCPASLITPNKLIDL
jgi:hypothetical protein